VLFAAGELFHSVLQTALLYAAQNETTATAVIDITACMRTYLEVSLLMLLLQMLLLMQGRTVEACKAQWLDIGGSPYTNLMLTAVSAVGSGTTAAATAAGAAQAAAAQPALPTAAGASAGTTVAASQSAVAAAATQAAASHGADSSSSTTAMDVCGPEAAEPVAATAASTTHAQQADTPATTADDNVNKYSYVDSDDGSGGEPHSDSANEDGDEHCSSAGVEAVEHSADTFTAAAAAAVPDRSSAEESDSSCSD
jgi:hypothetical protein